MTKKDTERTPTAAPRTAEDSMPASEVISAKTAKTQSVALFQKAESLHPIFLKFILYLSFKGKLISKI
jgi:hypothetical protein